MLDQCPKTEFESQGKARSKGSQESCISNSIVERVNWVFISNKIVAYWPFSIGSTSANNDKRIINFDFPTFSLYISLAFLALNLAYGIQYFTFQFHDEASTRPLFDLIIITAWDQMVVVGVTLIRIYGIVSMDSFHLFWNQIVNIVKQCVSLSSEHELNQKFKALNWWGLKWIVAFGLLGIIDTLAVIYYFAVASSAGFYALIVYTRAFLELVISMHNSNALLLVFFIKLIVHGYHTCKRSLVQISELEGLTITTNQETTSLTRDSPLTKVFQLIDDLESSVEMFNKLFAFSLFLEVAFGFLQILFAMYFLNAGPYSNFAYIANMLAPITMYSICLISLCRGGSQLMSECQGMIAAFQKLPKSSLSPEDCHKIQLLVARVSSEPPTIQVAQLFQIRESLLSSAFNTLATYFIVLIQMKQATRSDDNPVESGVEINFTQVSNST